MKEVLLKLFQSQVTILALCFVVTACSSKTSIKYTESEVQLIPPISFARVFMPGSLVIVKTNDLTVQMRVKSYKGNDYIIGLDEGGKELIIALKDIKEIAKIKERPRAKRDSSTSAEDLGELAIYAPLIPVGVVWPAIGGPLGLDAEANSRELQKALLIYGGMTREELRANVGEPQQRYQCKDESEVWTYNAEQVLNGGKFIFISNWNQRVYFTSYRFLKKKDCSPMVDEKFNNEQ